MGEAKRKEEPLVVEVEGPDGKPMKAWVDDGPITPREREWLDRTMEELKRDGVRPKPQQD